MKTFWERIEENMKLPFHMAPLKKKMLELIKKEILNFYFKHKENKDFLSYDDVQTKINKSSIFNWSIWKTISKNDGIREYSFIFATSNGIIFEDFSLNIYTNKGVNCDRINYLELSKAKFLKNNTVRYFHRNNNKDVEFIAEPFTFELLKDVLNNLNFMANNFDKIVQQEADLERTNFKKLQLERINELDKNKDGKVDLIENDFSKILSKNQKAIISIDRNYIHNFVKVSNYISVKKENIQSIFESIINTNGEAELNERFNLLKNQIHTYEILIFHSINMIISLIDDDMLSFYEIYESFDKLRIFNSNWENEVSDKLSDIGENMQELVLAIDSMENKIINQIRHLSYITEQSFNQLNFSVSNQLKEINSSINVNNLLSTIQTYQLYKINKQTKTIG